MKIAVSSTGNSLNSKIDQRFGRCSWFFIYDTETRAMEFIPNPNKEANEGAGPAAAELIASRGVQKVIAGEFGMKVKPLMDSLRIQMIIIKDEDKTLQDMVDIVSASAGNVGKTTN